MNDSPENIVIDVRERDSTNTSFKKKMFDVLKSNTSSPKLKVSRGLGRGRGLGLYDVGEDNAVENEDIIEEDDVESPYKDFGVPLLDPNTNYFSENCSELNDSSDGNLDNRKIDDMNLSEFRKLNYLQVEKSIDKHYSNNNNKY